ncbi:hypothetical protein OV203_26835 [Nannocystis sp. ILAH1]|uniref:hypothetical protein n=1 Tax=unclassified Nannocystis TaxID=2627009 RepID=UPI00226FE46E|nr:MULTISPECIES: hypothetical protein [unclassified Nannocystis]MCY0990790.1 hypothetical protein [Nannocystis sp. ILAH1]MCY1072320.1 hypothetical protein [Nannocystis sp. RBIL2]
MTRRRPAAGTRSAEPAEAPAAGPAPPFNTNSGRAVFLLFIVAGLAGAFDFARSPVGSQHARRW